METTVKYPDSSLLCHQSRIKPAFFLLVTGYPRGGQSEYVNSYMLAQPPEEEKVAICNHQADRPLNMWPDV